MPQAPHAVVIIGITPHEEGLSYPIYCRKRCDAEEEVYLNLNELAEDHDYFHMNNDGKSRSSFCSVACRHRWW